MDGTLANLPLNVMWKKWETSYEEDGQRFVLAGIWLDYQKQEVNEKWIVYGTPVKDSGKKKKTKKTMKAAMKTMKAMKAMHQHKNMKVMKQKKVGKKVYLTESEQKKMQKEQHQKWRHI